MGQWEGWGGGSKRKVGSWKVPGARIIRDTDHGCLNCGGELVISLATASRCFLVSTNSCSFCFTSEDAIAPGDTTRWTWPSVTLGPGAWNHATDQQTVWTAAVSYVVTRSMEPCHCLVNRVDRSPQSCCDKPISELCGQELSVKIWDNEYRAMPLISKPWAEELSVTLLSVTGVIMEPCHLIRKPCAQELSVTLWESAWNHATD